MELSTQNIDMTIPTMPIVRAQDQQLRCRYNSNQNPSRSLPPPNDTTQKTLLQLHFPHIIFDSHYRTTSCHLSPRACYHPIFTDHHLCAHDHQISVQGGSPNVLPADFPLQENNANVFITRFANARNWLCRPIFAYVSQRQHHGTTDHLRKLARLSFKPLCYRRHAFSFSSSQSDRRRRFFCYPRRSTVCLAASSLLLIPCLESTLPNDDHLSTHASRAFLILHASFGRAFLQVTIHCGTWHWQNYTVNCWFIVEHFMLHAVTYISNCKYQ